MTYSREQVLKALSFPYPPMEQKAWQALDVLKEVAQATFVHTKDKSCERAEEVLEQYKGRALAAEQRVIELLERNRRITMRPTPPPPERTPAKSPLDLLIKTRTLLRKPYAWTRGALEQYDSEHKVWQHCLTGAMSIFDSTHWSNSSEACLYMQARPAVLSQIRPLGFEDIEGFNDAKGRKKKEVLAVLDKAIEALKEAT